MLFCEGGFEEFIKFVVVKGIEFDGLSGEVLNASLARVVATFELEVTILFRGLVMCVMLEV